MAYGTRRVGVEHRVIDDKLAAPPEEVAECLLPMLPLEGVWLFDELPRQVAPLPAQLVAHPRELLLLCQVPLPRLEPLVVLHYRSGSAERCPMARALDRVPLLTAACASASLAATVR
jgi:hypothetical protein